jgi:hypothetical protein
MEISSQPKSVGAALLAITKSITADQADVANQILFQVEYRITPEDFQKASKQLARMQVRNPQIFFDSISIICFWPLFIGGAVYLWNHSFNTAFWTLYAVLILSLVPRVILRNRATKKAITDNRDYFENTAVIYVTRVGLGIVSGRQISVSAWSYYKELKDGKDYYFLTERTGVNRIYPKSIFRSAEDAEKFEALIKALMADKPIDHLIKQDGSWPPKPTF